MILKARDLTLKVRRKSIFPVWRVDLDLAEGERVAVVGESGGGKTSLAWGLMGRPLPGQQVVSGDVGFRGRDLLSLSSVERARLYYAEMALVPQNAQNAFHPTQRLWKSAREVIAKGRKETSEFRVVIESVADFSELLEFRFHCGRGILTSCRVARNNAWPLFWRF